jgi:hypothetical protein
MEVPDLSPEERGRRSLLLANELFRTAFAVCRARFAREHPELAPEELDRLTAKYFAELPASPE